MKVLQENKNDWIFYFWGNILKYIAEGLKIYALSSFVPFPYPNDKDVPCRLLLSIHNIGYGNGIPSKGPPRRGRGLHALNVPKPFVFQITKSLSDFLGLTETTTEKFNGGLNSLTLVRNSQL